MTQRDLNRAIARATGESVHHVSTLGFVELTPVVQTGGDFEDGPAPPVPPAIVDWDELDEQRAAAGQAQPVHPSLVLR